MISILLLFSIFMLLLLHLWFQINDFKSFYINIILNLFFYSKILPIILLKFCFSIYKTSFGIYRVVNLVTNQFYVVWASTGNITTRLNRQIFYLTVNRPIANAINKYGLSQFAFLLLEIIPEQDSFNNTIIIDRENFYLESLLPQYNYQLTVNNKVPLKY